MSDLVVPFLIFGSLYTIFLFCIAQDVACEYIKEGKHFSYWVGTWAFVSMWGLIPSFIIFDLAGNPPDVARAILACLLPTLGILLAAAVGLFIRHRDSEPEAPLPTDPQD